MRKVTPSRNGKLSKPSNPATVDERNAIDRRLDHLNELWRTTELELLTMQPPRHIAVEFKTEFFGEDGDIELSHWLGVQRFAGKWRVCYGTNHSDQNPERAAWKPIRECSVDVRMMAAMHIKVLVDEVVKTGEKFIPELDAAIHSLERLLAAI
jgi:hypothetical protein